MNIQLLDGQWRVSQVKSKDWIPATVPGNIHIDLQTAGVIPDPFYGDNEFRVQWVAETDWIYRREFEADEALFTSDRIYIECDGIDTLSEVCLNGVCVALTENMFIRHRVDVTDMLRKGKNVIEVRIKSPVKHCEPLLKNPGTVVSPGDYSIPGGPFIRKSPCQWGWDWGPKLPTSGIWRSIRLVGYTKAKLENLHIRQKHLNDGSVKLHMSASLDWFSKGDLSARVRLTGPDGSVIEHATPLKQGKKWTCAPLEVKNPKLWWPNGYGDQPLYQLEVSLVSNGKVVHTETRQIGLRTLKLEQKKDKYGKSFTFVVNGVHIFCKGANWIPADSFPSRLACEWYEDLIASAAKAHMNMLRIWGGGFYEHECFYDLCDKYGILVWHDFMFACSHYPVNEAYLDNVRMEVRENVRRIRHRACLALWCGNNEMEWFLAGGYPNNGNNFQHKLEHHKLFREVIPEVVIPEDPDTPYWPSSPCSCTEFDNPNCEHEGDGHYWDVWHGRLPFTAYRSHYYRFMSEFGFQSLPCMDTVKQFAEPRDWNMTSYIMECHQKNGGANGLILYYLGQTLRFPKDFPSMVYASQILQAEAIRYGVEHWRRNRERCMGTLYWQLNDCWPVASWSSIDYNRNWKGLHYSARRFYNPVLISAEEEGTKVDLHVTNDLLQQFEGTVKWSLEKLDGSQIKSGEEEITVPAESDKLAVKLDFAKDIEKDGVRDTVLVYQLFQKDKCLSTGLVAFCPPKHLDMPDAKIDVKVVKANGSVEISLTPDKTARFVEVYVPETNLRLSDNFFDLPAGRTKIVQVESPDTDPEWLKKHIVVRSLRDSY